MTTGEAKTVPTPSPRLEIAAATFEDITAAFGAGVRDTLAYPVLSLFFGVAYALFGAALIAGFVIVDQVWIAIPVGVGFPLVAPFLAAGLYEISRRRALGEAFAVSEVFLCIFKQQRREFAWMSFVLLFVFWVWAYQVRIVLAITLQNEGLGSLDQLVSVLFGTIEGATFLAIGSLIGAVLSTILYSITVISMPLLLDKNVDFVTAMITSVKTVLKSPVVMLGWGAVVGALTLLSVATVFLGVIVVFPLLGHTTWHLYARLISER
jgi:uncharacterized membrane protein